MNDESRRTTGKREVTSIETALRSAAEHARNALAEGATAARFLLEAAALGATGAPAADNDVLREMAQGLERARRLLEGGNRPDAERWMARVSEALEAEIARWEARGRDDPEARAVLRAFLGVREVLWEFGLRPPAPKPRPERPAARPGDRLQRVTVEG